MRTNVVYQLADTICAVASAPGIGGIAVVRVSGAEALPIVDTLFVGRERLSEMSARRATYGSIFYADEQLDDVVVTTFRAPQSFTGEDTVEIACHGSLYIQERLLRALLAQGCRSAQPGEFTMRAYMNGRMDLAQAEAVADLIAARSAVAHRLARSQMSGAYSNRLNEVANELIRFASLMELELDFAEEDVEFADRSQLRQISDRILNDLQRLVDSYAAGNAIRTGLPIAIVGATNVGKSTLLNTLLGRERAIVSEIAGTTRDTIEDTLTLGGIVLRIVDTAGIRSTNDEIEALGIERTYRQIEEATIVLYLLDASLPLSKAVTGAAPILNRVGDKPLILLANKADLTPAFDVDGLPIALQKYPLLSVSAKEDTGLDDLRRMLISIARQYTQQSDVVVSNARHYEALRQALEAIGRVAIGLDDGVSVDFLTPDLRHCIGYIEEITGRSITSDTILHNIFAHFCIGK